MSSLIDMILTLHMKKLSSALEFFITSAKPMAEVLSDAASRHQGVS